MFPSRSEARDGSPKVNGEAGEAGGRKPLFQVAPPSCEVEKALKRSWVKNRPCPGKNSTTAPAELLYPTTTFCPWLITDVSLWTESSKGRVLTVGRKSRMWSSAG